jgi:hypothetical protein
VPALHEPARLAEPALLHPRLGVDQALRQPVEGAVGRQHLDAELGHSVDGPPAVERLPPEDDEGVRLEDAARREADVERRLADPDRPRLPAGPVPKAEHEAAEELLMPLAWRRRRDHLAIEELDPVHRLGQGEELLLAHQGGSACLHRCGL